MKNDVIANGVVESLCVNGEPVEELLFQLGGPEKDLHSGFYRRLSGHDGAYIKTSELTKGAEVFNWRSWTALSYEEVSDIEKSLGLHIPIGCLLENILISGIPNFSKLAPTSRLVFPKSKSGMRMSQAILAVWEENGPCKKVGQRLEEHHNTEGLTAKFVKTAQNKRGVMGFVLSSGRISVGDTVLVCPPVQ